MGGEDIYVNLLIKLLREKGHRVKLYAKHSSSIEQNLNNKMAVATNLVYNRQTATELQKIIRVFKPDIAHIHNVYPLISPSAYIICKNAGVSIVQTIHNYRFMCAAGTLYHGSTVCKECLQGKSLFPCIWHRCYRNSFVSTILLTITLMVQRNRIIKTIDRFIFPTYFSKKIYEEYFNLPKSKSIVIHHGLKIADNSSQKSDSPSNYFLFIGRLSKEKGILDLVKHISKKPKISLIVVGTGPLAKELETYRKYTHIKFMGSQSRNKTLKLMQNARAVIIPSKWYEVLPLVYIESLALNVPVLTPDTETFSFTRTTNNRYQYSFGNMNELMARMEHFSYDKKSNYFRKIYEKYFSEKNHYTQLMECYSSLIN